MTISYGLRLKKYGGRIPAVVVRKYSHYRGIGSEALLRDDCSKEICAGGNADTEP